MVDMTAFERQLADESLRIVGQSRPVDDLAVCEAVTAARSPQRTVQTMVSATRLVVGGAVVALFGGFLLAGGTIEQSEEALPGASSSPAATSDLLPGVGLITEEVEPGVYRVVSDGTDNDMTLGARYPGDSADLVAGWDGSVWVRDWQGQGEDRLFRLGVAGTIDASGLHDYWPDLSVAADGTLWALGDSARDWDAETGVGQLLSLADGVWIPHAVPDDVRVTGVETSADGSIWTSWSVGSGRLDSCSPGSEVGRLAVARLADGEWVEERAVTATPGDGGHLAIGADGTTLLGTTYHHTCPDGAWVGVVERDEDGWAPSITFDADADSGLRGVGPIAIGSDGTVWAYHHDNWPDPWSPRLLRRTDGDWEVLGDDGSVPLLVGAQTWGSSLTVSPDGRVWVALEGPTALDAHREWGKSIAATLAGPCAGVLAFDGTKWTQHLAGACATRVAAAPNGNVWVSVVEVDPVWFADWAGNDPGRALRSPQAGSAGASAGLYVITPSAVAAPE